jgi:hypothetical protein
MTPIYQNPEGKPHDKRVFALTGIAHGTLTSLLSKAGTFGPKGITGQYDYLDSVFVAWQLFLSHQNLEAYDDWTQAWEDFLIYSHECLTSFQTLVLASPNVISATYMGPQDELQGYHLYHCDNGQSIQVMEDGTIFIADAFIGHATTISAKGVNTLFANNAVAFAA